MENKSAVLTELKNENVILLKNKLLNNCDNVQMSSDSLDSEELNKLFNKIEMNSSIIHERNEEIEEIFRDVLCIKDIFEELNKMANLQREEITKIEDNLEKTEIKIENAIVQISKSQKYYNSITSTKNKFVLLGALGLAINIPVALFFGLKVASVSSVGAIGLSALSSLITKK